MNFDIPSELWLNYGFYEQFTNKERDFVASEKLYKNMCPFHFESLLYTILIANVLEQKANLNRHKTKIGRKTREGHIP